MPVLAYLHHLCNTGQCQAYIPWGQKIQMPPDFVVNL